MTADESSRQMQGAIALLKTGIDAGSRRVEDLHMAIADKPFRILRMVPVVADVSDAVQHIHDGITRGVHQAVRGLTAVGCDAAVRIIALQNPPR
ncbi:MAG: hypothetical protein QE272_11230 [Nevskia sp.]|nr:hypothetical protein [Gammaproteobacteria bacterium]MDH4459266.1 hypothetical protein [Nevskia sp.]